MAKKHFMNKYIELTVQYNYVVDYSKKLLERIQAEEIDEDTARELSKSFNELVMPLTNYAKSLYYIIELLNTSKQRFDNYYKNIVQGYKDVLEQREKLLKELSTSDYTEEERKCTETSLELTTKPIIHNYFMVTAIKFVLDIPTRKQKQKKYYKMKKYTPETIDESMDNHIILNNGIIEELESKVDYYLGGKHD